MFSLGLDTGSDGTCPGKAPCHRFPSMGDSPHSFLVANLIWSLHGESSLVARKRSRTSLINR